ncbi:7446_t:CDS:2, partial [Gigaspora rosea]
MAQQLENSFLEINNIKFLPYDFFEQIETNGTVLSSNSYRVVSKNHNKIIVLNYIVHSQNYTLEDFVNECKENSTIESEGLNTTDLLQHTNLQSEIEIELKLMSSIIETLKKSKTSLNEKVKPILPDDQNVEKNNDDQKVENNNDQEVTSNNDDQEVMSNNEDEQEITDDQFLYDLKTLFTNNNDEPQFLYDLSKLFIDQFNIQGVSKENQFIGLISLGSLYTLGKGIAINQQKAFQLFLKSVAKGSIL